MDEAKTRQEIIDHRLGLAGWDVWEASQVIQELDIELAKGGAPDRLPRQSPAMTLCTAT